MKIQEQFKNMKFVYDNSDSFIMNTFGWLWSTKEWWDNKDAKIDRFITPTGEIETLHAFYISHALQRIKTYYIVVHVNRRGEGLAKALIKKGIVDYSGFTYYVNSEENSAGVKFYTKWLGEPTSKKSNDFGTNDFIWEVPVKEVLLK